ncbi:acylneuraminate cytidylyltransferase [Sphingosinithalassobacter tenebrarum]|uniref:N-acylneuraminate cytidylyltransferase n=1 Tax=Stakelama tenebrarum TaxID=2711215 RepID=A0A6G6Y409_9SPHN|nr:acylneuraminate cytidylyltransferase [Sphingosinithalassobacter tenebrarum]
MPRKNVLPLAGKPLIAHTILAARESSLISRVVVSTDDAEIAAAARDAGAEIVWRPADLAGDMAKSEDAVLHVLGELESNEGYSPEITVMIQCTSPLTAAEDLDGTIGKLIDADADTALAVTAFHYFLWQNDAEGEAIAVNHDKSFRLMRQQRTPEFVETGAVYAMRTARFREVKHRFFGKTVLHETPPERRLEIDEPEDFRVAEERFGRLRRSREAALPARPSAIMMDFDGVFTDDRVFVSETGEESVVCSRRDGMGIERLRGLDIPMVVISKEQNSVVAARCRKLRLEHHHGIDNKLALARDWFADRGIDPKNAIFVGNDRNDVECMTFVGTAVAPRDAHRSALDAADIVLDADGGRGAIRLLADMIEAKQAGDH